mgnify:CR=1 FL=1
MTKKEARKVYKEKRLSLTVGERNRFDDLILIHFQQLSLPDLFYVHTYLAIKAQVEIETDHLLHFLEFRNPELNIVIPRMNQTTNELEHIEYDETVNVVSNEWGIPEPVNGTLLSPMIGAGAMGGAIGTGMPTAVGAAVAGLRWAPMRRFQMRLA